MKTTAVFGLRRFVFGLRRKGFSPTPWQFFPYVFWFLAYVVDMWITSDVALAKPDPEIRPIII